MTLPQVNATLTAVYPASAATGGSDDWDHPGLEPDGPDIGSDPDAPVAKWTGDEPAYYKDRMGWGGTDVGRVKVPTLIVPTELAISIGIDTDDVIVWTDLDGAEHRGVAADIPTARLEGIPADVQTTRIEMQPN